MSWGWRVQWDKNPIINAKSETITQLPTFKPHLQNRCLILADGFFEKGIRFIQPGEPLFAMAGLWQPDSEGGKFTMLRCL
jgi:putative SOS response-associated peptidase YedK